MRDYQRKAESEYYLPYSLYRRVIFFVKDYDRMTAEKNRITVTSVSKNENEKNNKNIEKAEGSLLKLKEIDRDIEIIKQSLSKIPEEYREGVFDNLRYGIIPAKVPAHRNTLGKYKKRFLYFVAQGKLWV